MARPRNPKGIKPRVTDAKAYELALRRAFLRPFANSLWARLALAAAVNDTYGLLEQGVNQWEAQPNAGIPKTTIIEALGKVRDFNRKKLFQTFRNALSVDIRPYLTQSSVQPIMTQAISNNIDLVKTIPRRFHAGLRERLGQEFLDAPFDKQRLRAMFEKEYGLQDYNLRRITRTETSKLNGELVRIQHGQLGIADYIWRTSEDERVRPSHSEKNGKTFAWASPPPDTGHPGHDIQCRCYAEPVITPTNRNRLKGR